MNGVSPLYGPKWQGEVRPGLELVGRLEEEAQFMETLTVRRPGQPQSWPWGRLIGHVIVLSCQPLHGHFMSGFVPHYVCRAPYGLWHLLVG